MFNPGERAKQEIDPRLQKIDSARINTLEYCRSFTIDNSNYLENLNSIASNNPELSLGINNYGHIEEDFADFKINCWGNGAIESHRINSIGEIVRFNKDYYPNTSVASEIFNEWRKRTSIILEELKNFSGDNKQAFDLAQRLHKEYCLDPLNPVEPLMQKIDDDLKSQLN